VVVDPRLDPESKMMELERKPEEPLAEPLPEETPQIKPKSLLPVEPEMEMRPGLEKEGP
jgi:hypothetical protein